VARPAAISSLTFTEVDWLPPHSATLPTPPFGGDRLVLSRARNSMTAIPALLSWGLNREMRAPPMRPLTNARRLIAFTIKKDDPSDNRGRV